MADVQQRNTSAGESTATDAPRRIPAWEPPQGLDCLVAMLRSVAPAVAAELLRCALDNASVHGGACALEQLREHILEPPQ